MRNMRMWALPMVVAGLMLAACDEKKKDPEPKPGDPPTEIKTGKPQDDVKIDLTNAGSVTGMIKFEGTMPTPKKSGTDADPICHAKHKEIASESFVGKDGGFGNVYVVVKTGLPKGNYPKPAAKALLDQDGCRYTPHVVALQTGQTLEFRNSDETAHNVHGMAKINQEFNFAMPGKGSVERTFGNREVFKLKCDIHGWMAAMICVSEHPYFAISAEDGTFKIEGLPPGDYEIEATHEKLGAQKISVKIEAKGTAKADFTFKEE